MVPLADVDISLDLGMLCFAIISVSATLTVFFLTRKMAKSVIDIHMSIQDTNTKIDKMTTAKNNELGSS